MKLLPTLIFLILVLGIASCSEISQQADPDFQPRNNKQRFNSDNSPVILVDEAHHNFLTINERYKPFAQVLSSDGYTVKANTSRFTMDVLTAVDILVIANALDKKRSDWSPPFGYAIDDGEVANLLQWVFKGGALFLVADHTPFSNVIENLTSALGFEFSNGHVNTAVFRIQDNTLAKHMITGGEAQSSNEQRRSPLPQIFEQRAGSSDRITQVKSFGGSAFKAPENSESLLILGPGSISLVPDIPFQVNSATPRLPIEGWSQGAVLQYGKGRVAVFSEGMMFSSQLDTKTGQKFGLRSVGAEQNELFLLNIMHWLQDTP